MTLCKGSSVLPVECHRTVRITGNQLSRKLLSYELSWKLTDLDNAAGLACKTFEVSDMWFLSSFFGWKDLKSPPPLIESALSFLMPSVAHMELFAASPGSSILNVFGIQRDLSELPSFGGSSSSEELGLKVFSSLECFPNVGELGPELGPAAFGDAGWGSQGMFQAPGTLQPQ